ncbi:MAG TPA: outer membrane lipoprotein carrier protein LolA [Mucilaginibacter sp.]|nr:outer membrane lipoprotein carrier protein LolA [Mucilaginibacter sp.]
MKKLLITAILSVMFIGYSYAQKDADARAILNKVSAKYKSYNVVKTDFTFQLDNQQAGIKETQSGTLIAKSKQNKFKVSLYGKAAGAVPQQEIISDGKTQWTYLRKDNEVQVNNFDNSGDGLNPAKIFTIYEKGYKYVYTGEKRIAGRIYQEIDLTPENDSKGFYKVRLEIDKIKRQLYSALIFDKNGNRYTYTIKNFSPNVSVPESTFTFDPKAHKGVEVVDLR